MELTEGLERVLREEEEAWEMAARVGALAQHADLHEVAAELEAFQRFLAGELELHLRREEIDLFPKLAARGLAPEVEQAKLQHQTIRQLRDDLTAVDAEHPEALREALKRMSEELIHHLHYEADFLYVDLSPREAAVFHSHLAAAMQAVGPVRRRGSHGR